MSRIKIALYPGTFDPITYGHLDIIKRSMDIVDKLYIGIANNREKKVLFSIKDRKIIIDNTVKKLPLNIRKKLIVTSFEGLTIDFCKKVNATILIRGLRVVADFEYEFQLACMNNNLNKNVQTIFLMADIQNQAISSDMVKEISNHGGNVSKFVPKSALKLLKQKFKKLWKYIDYLLYFF